MKFSRWLGQVSWEQPFEQRGTEHDIEFLSNHSKDSNVNQTLEDSGSIVRTIKNNRLDDRHRQPWLLLKYEPIVYPTATIVFSGTSTWLPCLLVNIGSDDKLLKASSEKLNAAWPLHALPSKMGALWKDMETRIDKYENRLLTHFVKGEKVLVG